MKSVKQLSLAVSAAIALVLALPNAMASVQVAAAGDSGTTGSGASGSKNGSGDTTTQPGSQSEKMKRPTDGGSPTDGSSSEHSGGMVDDSTITAEVKSALVDDGELKSAHNINVNTKKGEVVLSGKGDSQDQIDK